MIPERKVFTKFVPDLFKLCLIACLIIILIFITACRGAESGIPPQNLPVAAAASSLKLDQKDLSGDGTEDIRLDNGRMWLQYNGDSPGAIAIGGMTGGEPVMMPITSRITGETDQMREVSPARALSDKAGLIGYTFTVKYASGIDVDWTVTMREGEEFARVTAVMKNSSGTKLNYGGSEAFAKNGIGLLQITPTLGECIPPDRSKNDSVWVGGTGEIEFGQLDTTKTVAVDSEPFTTVYDSATKDAITWGYLKPYTSKPEQFVLDNSPEHKGWLSSILGQISLNPGDKAEFNMFIDFHPGGPSAGEALFKNIGSRE